MPEREALAFDLYGTLVDPIGVSVELQRVLDRDVALDLARLWRGRQLDYSFRLTVMHVYRDFQWVTRRALDDALMSMGLQLSEAERAHLVDTYDHLPAFPDTPPALRTLRERGLMAAVFSNGTPSMIENCLANNGLRADVDLVISVDAVRAFKPAPQVYAYCASEMARPIDTIRLVSSNPFDVIGAQNAGMKTAWCNRGRLVFDTIGGPPDLETTDLLEVAAVLGEADA